MPVVVVLEFDSDFAAKAVRRQFRVKCNLPLVLRARVAHDLVAARVQWVKVESHTGSSLMNERADCLAACGASGLALHESDVRRWAQALRP
eukprot:14741982-Alexandrium_andersonii.AAC.1